MIASRLTGTDRPDFGNALYGNDGQKRVAVSVHATALSSLAGNAVTSEAVAEIHPGRWFSTSPVDRTPELSHAVSVTCSLVASVPIASWQVNSERGECGNSRRPWAAAERRGNVLEHRRDRQARNAASGFSRRKGAKGCEISRTRYGITGIRCVASGLPQALRGGLSARELPARIARECKRLTCDTGRTKQCRDRGITLPMPTYRG